MKIKAILTLALAVLGIVSMNARDDYSTDPGVLPQAARTTLNSHFGKQKVSHIKIDKDLFGIDSYDVVLNDGTEVDFDSKGKLKEVDCGRNGVVPSSLILKPIQQYVNSNFNGQKIIKYDVKRNGYEVELSSGLDLEFNRDGTFRRIDD